LPEECRRATPPAMSATKAVIAHDIVAPGQI
jgi:hypothetical protein